MLTIAPADLDLIDYLILDIQVNSNKLLQDGKEKRIKRITTSDLEILLGQRDIADDNIITATLMVETKKGKDHSELPATFSITVLASFKAKDVFAQKIRNDSEGVSYARLGITNTLYGIIREQLHAITARMGTIPMALPSCVLGFDPSQPDETDTPQTP